METITPPRSVRFSTLTIGSNVTIGDLSVVLGGAEVKQGAHIGPATLLSHDHLVGEKSRVQGCLVTKYKRSLQDGKLLPYDDLEKEVEQIVSETLSLLQKTEIIASSTATPKSKRKILVTGAAGFIGFHTSRKLLERGDTVIGLDNFNDYYDVSLKESRAGILDDYEDFSMRRIDLADREAVEALFASEKFEKVVHLAAQAGVRYSIENPHAYIDANLVGFLNGER